MESSDGTEGDVVRRFFLTFLCALLLDIDAFPRHVHRLSSLLSIGGLKRDEPR